MSTRDAINKARSDTSLSSASSKTIQSAFKKRKVDAANTNEGANMSDSPTLQVNDVPLESDSTETVRINPNHNSNEKEYLAFKLDKLNDKKARFESHESYLTKCLTNNLIPNGLKVYVEPSIGNRDETFLTKWYGTLDEFSRKLTNLVVEFSEQEITKTNEEIAAISQRLKTRLSDNEFTKINEVISTNRSIREKELQQRKNRKFYGLKYKNNPNNRYASNHPNARSPGTYEEENTMQRGRTEERNQPDYRNRNENDNTRQGATYATAVKNRPYQQQRSPHHYDNQLKRNNSRVWNPPRKWSSHRNLPQAFNNRNNDNETSHAEPTSLSERISLHRRNSRINFPPRHMNTTTDNSRANEIEELQRRLNLLETKDQTPERVMQHEVIHHDNPPKNTSAAQRTDMGANNDISEMRSYLKSVMETISAFDKRLTTQLNTGSIPSERS